MDISDLLQRLGGEGVLHLWCSEEGIGEAFDVDRGVGGWGAAAAEEANGHSGA